MRSGESNDDDKAIQVLMISNPDVFDIITDNDETYDFYKNITTKFSKLGTCVIFDSVPDENIGFGGNKILRSMADDLNMLMFDNLDDIKITIIMAAVKREFNKPLQPGECYYMHGSEFSKIKTLLSPIRAATPEPEKEESVPS